MRYDRGSQNQDLHGRLRTIAAVDRGTVVLFTDQYMRVYMADLW